MKKSIIRDKVLKSIASCTNVNQVYKCFKLCILAYNQIYNLTKNEPLSYLIYVELRYECRLKITKLNENR